MTAAADQSSNEGESHSFSLGSFSDPGDDSALGRDGRLGRRDLPADQLHGGLGRHDRGQSHTYADGPNHYTVTVSVNDSDATDQQDASR